MTKKQENLEYCIDCDIKRTERDRSYLLRRCQKCMDKVEIEVKL